MATEQHKAHIHLSGGLAFHDHDVVMTIYASSAESPGEWYGRFRVPPTMGFKIGAQMTDDAMGSIQLDDGRSGQIVLTRVGWEEGEGVIHFHGADVLE